MPDGQAQPVPGISGQINTGEVSPSGVAQQQIQEPKHQVMAAGADLVNLGINAAYGTPDELEALRNLDNAVIGGMQQRWWQEQDKQFTSGKGKEYERGTATLQATYMEELAGAADLTDPWERQSAMNAAHGRMWTQLSKLDTDYMMKASKYSNNPIISNRVGTLIQQRTELMNKIMGGRKETAAETESLSRAELYQKQAGAAGEEEQGFYTTTRAKNAAKLPDKESAANFIIAQNGGREEVKAETNQIMSEREASLGVALRQYQQVKASGNMAARNDAAKKFEELFFVDPDLLADEDSETLLNIWRSEAQPRIQEEAVSNIFNRLLSVARGYQPEQQTSAPSAPGAETPRIKAAETQPRQRILAEGTGQEAEERAQLGTQLSEQQGTTDIDVHQARVAMGGDVPETIEMKALRARDNMIQRYKDAGLPLPPQWSADVTDEVVEFADRIYRSLPAMTEAQLKRQAQPMEIRKYLDGLSDSVQRIFEMPDKGPWPAGLDRNDIIWINLIKVHSEMLEKHPEWAQIVDIHQMIEGAVSNLAVRAEQADPKAAKRKIEKATGLKSDRRTSGGGMGL